MTRGAAGLVSVFHRPGADAAQALGVVVVKGIVAAAGAPRGLSSPLEIQVVVVVVAARRGGQVHVVATAAAAVVLGAVAATAGRQLLLVVAVVVGFVADARVPGLVGVEGAVGAARAAVGRLVGAGGGAVVAVLELADLVVEPAYDAARRGLGRPVGSVISLVPGKV